MSGYKSWCQSAPENVEKLMHATAGAVEKVYGGGTLRRLGRPFLVGSGTAYAAALAANQAFADLTGWSGEWVRVMTAQEYARMAGEAVLGAGAAWVLLVDLDGDAMTLSAAQTARDHGAHLTVITRDGAGAAAGLADGVVPLPAGTGATAEDFVAAQLAPAQLALAAGLAHGRMTDGELSARRREMSDYMKACCRAALEAQPQLDALARGAARRVRCWETMGTGPDYAVAWAARALVYEHLGTVCTVEETEDWLHVNFLQLTPEEFGTLLFISQNNPSAERSLRTARYVEGVGRTTVVITDAAAQELPQGASVLSLPPAPALWMQPLGTLWPAALLLEAMSS